MTYNLLIGSHIKMTKADKYLIGSANEMLSYGANIMMIYSASPRSVSNKAPIKDLNIAKFDQILQAHNLNKKHFIIHASYLINLGNTIKPSVYKLGVDLLRDEIDRALAIGIKTLVLHPGSSLGADTNQALLQVAKGLNEVLKPNDDIKIAIETMSGKGFELGRNFEEIKTILDHLELKDKVGVCFDTCHLNDANYDVKNDFDEVLQEFDQIVGLNKLWAIHLNDSKNVLNAHKDRHENLGHGSIGFEALLKIAYHPLLENVPKILETPYIDKKPPYGDEIAMIKTKMFKNIKIGL